MENLINWVSTNIFLSLALAAFVCGVALFYLVMMRTMKHRDATSETDSQ